MKNYKPIVKLIPPTPAEPEVTIQLSMEQARTLRAVLGKIAGCPTDTYRRHTDVLNRALASAGVANSVPELDKMREMFSGSICGLPLKSDD